MPQVHVTLISVCCITVALVIQCHLLDHIPLTYQFFCISVSFHQTSAGFEVGFHSRSGRYHCGSRRKTQKDVRNNYVCNSIKMKHSASITFYGVLAHHIQHSNKLVNPCQHLFQALLQTQDLEEKPLKENTVKMSFKLCRNQSQTVSVHFKFNPTHHWNSVFKWSQQGPQGQNTEAFVFPQSQFSFFLICLVSRISS